jgi:hypothetical protein
MHLSKLFLAVFVLVLALSAVACNDDPSAQYFPAGPLAQASPALDSTSSAQTDTNAMDARFIHGSIDRPDPKLTPGVVAITDLGAVCHLTKRVHTSFLTRSPLMSAADQQAVLAEYKIPAQKALHYGLDFLVPLQLGGANVRANIWPVSTAHGLGFREKEILNIRLHVLVCQRQLPLDQAQREIVTDWVKLWLKVG